MRKSFFISVLMLTFISIDSRGQNEFLSKKEIRKGFKSLFDGQDLEHWTGNKTDYIVENNELKVRPKNGGRGNLYTVEEYSDFNFRFQTI